MKMPTTTEESPGEEFLKTSRSQRLRTHHGVSSSKKKTIPRMNLDENGCLALASIVEAFNTPISEEHAWAISYQAAKCGQAILQNEAQRKYCLLVTNMKELMLHKDGYVHQSTFLDTQERSERSSRTNSSDEYKIVSELGAVIFAGLDYGFQDDEERNISSDLESFLDLMSSADQAPGKSENDDEGIERDSGDSDDESRANFRTFGFSSMLEVCSERLSNHSSSQTAEVHYRAVCRAYVAEALELSSFLQKVSQGTCQLRYDSRSPARVSEVQPELDKLNFADWARLWVQVIRDLRQGVKLKRVDFSREPPIEYGLTPYEILMDDIRSRRYKLNKVMVEGNLPKRIKKDAHAIILEFIRSRPPLKRAAERVLGPEPKRDQTPIEKLMESIRQQDHVLSPRDSFRASRRMLGNDSTEINSVNNNKSSSSQNETKSSSAPSAEPQQQAQSQRRLIKADMDLLYKFDSKDTDDDCGYSDEDEPTEGITDFFGHICPEGSQSTPTTPCKKQSQVKCGSGEVDKARRHSICNPTVRGEHSSTMITFPFEYTNAVDVFNSLRGPRASPILHRRQAKLPRSMSKSSLQEEFFQSNHWQTAIECLSLNLEEVVHIRNVLTKAELESLPLDCSLKEDVEKGKVCFLCLKTRFSLIFGPWGNICKLCKRTVCSKCYSKMRIPTEQFENVPVSTLSPNISPRDEERELPGSTKSLTLTSRGSLTPIHAVNNNSSLRRSSVGSAPISPSMSRKSGGTDSDCGEQRSISPGLLTEDEERDHFPADDVASFGSNGPRSLPSVHSISMGLMAIKRNFVGRAKEEDKTDRTRGALMIVCHDCRAMVLQIIHSARAKKANLIRNNRTLDLPLPVH